MELVNRNYVRFDRSDIFSLMMDFTEKHDYEKLDFMQKMFSELSRYEKVLSFKQSTNIATQFFICSSVNEFSSLIESLF